MQQARVVYLAIGSIGDVLPLLRVARQQSSTCQCVFITHEQHKAWASSLAAGSGVSLKYVSTPPARVWNPEALSDPPGACAEGRRLEEHLQACLAALSLPGPRPEVTETTTAHEAQGPGKRLLVHNLFAMEAFSIAEALGVPSLALSPCLVPQTPPASLERQFKREHAALYASLNRPDGEVSDCVRWADVEHWLWPIFSTASCSWRQKSLGLGLPLSGKDLPKPPRLLYLLSPCLTQELPYWPRSVQLCGYPQATRKAERDLQPEADSPTSRDLPAQAPWSPSECLADACPRSEAQASAGSSQRALLPPVSPGNPLSCAGEQHLGEALAGRKRPRAEECDGSQVQKQASGKPVLIDMGSVGCMGLLDSPSRLLKVLQSALSTAGLRAVLLTGQWEALEKACTEEQASLAESGLQAVHGFVDHAVWMQQCSMVVHHGGLGTMLAALGAGLPAVACPLHFDQHQNADLLEHLELGVQVPGRVLANGDMRGAADRLAAAMRQVSASARLLANAQSMRDKLQAEDGIAVAAAIVQDSAAIPQPSATLRQAQSELTPAPKHDLTELSIFGQDSSGQQVITLPNGWHVCHSSHAEAAFIYNEIFEERCYIQHGISVRDGGVCVDVGANIGLFTLFLLGGFAGGLPRLILACEPAPANMRLLKQNIKTRRAAGKVVFVQRAVGREAASAALTYYPSMPGNSTLYPEEKSVLQAASMPAACFEGAETHATDVITLQELLEGFDEIDLLKVDIEGAELEVLRGAGQDTLSKIRQIVMEVHDIDERLTQVHELLERTGFRILGIEKGVCHTMLVFAARHGQ
ncbi:g1485 [Coccomyxa viridis]|uniref:G1485 protein n=1 Tax=Coccomyxa viridis TaxID=1274662 RepID=A0ABP1FLY3_9CHLO